MKLRKIIAAVAAAAMALSLTAFCASAEEIWSGSQNLGTSWDGNQALRLDVPNAAEGDEVIVSFTNDTSAEYNNLQLCVNVDGWPKLTAPKVNEYGSVEIAGMTSYTFNLNAKDAEDIKNGGLVVFGYGTTITSVVINSAAPAEEAAAEAEEAEEAAEEAPAADSDSAPAATGNTSAAVMLAVMAAAGATAVASRKRK